MLWSALMLDTPTLDSLALMADDKAFFKALGQRLAALRKEAGLSQQAVADQVGTARMPVSIVPAFAKLYGVDANELLGLQSSAGKRGRTPLLQKQIERLHQLPKTQQKIVMQMLDGVLTQANR